MSKGVKAVKYTGDEVVYGILRRGPLADLVPSACARQTELKRPWGEAAKCGMDIWWSKGRRPHI